MSSDHRPSPGYYWYRADHITVVARLAGGKKLPSVPG
jgi:hypothetical protein